MVDLVATPRSWKGVLFVILVVFAVAFWFAATGLIVWVIVVGTVAFVLYLFWLAIRGFTRRGERRFGGDR